MRGYVATTMLLAGATIGLLVPGIGMGQVYKCTSGGATAYQDKPCEGPAVQSVQVKARPSATGAPDGGRTIPAGSLAGLHQQIRAASDHERSLAEEYRRAGASLKLRARAMSHAEQVRESRAFTAYWQQRNLAASAQSNALMEELKRRCPNGAMLNASSQRCN